MLEATLHITTLSEWLVGGALDRSSGADNVQVRDTDGLPYLPGRTLRGLLHEAGRIVAEILGNGARQIYDSLFGSAGRPGRLIIGEGILPQETLDMIIQGRSPQQQEFLKRDFCAVLTRTAIDPDTGSAQEHSLRRTEVGIPGLIFLAPVQVSDEPSLQFVGFAAGLVRVLGADRYRGLGRCRMVLYRDGKPVDGLAWFTTAAKGTQR